MKISIKAIVITICMFALVSKLQAQQAKELLNILNLDYPGLNKVKALLQDEEYDKASAALLEYYRERTTINHPEVNLEDKASFKGKKLDDAIVEKANNGLLHQFFIHKGYGYFDYGDTINWQNWPVKDNEVRWQLHRMYWWIPMGQMYWATGDEKYAKEWVYQMQDWIKDNPRGLSEENDRFAWRPLEVSRRVQDQTNMFVYFINSPSFTPEFLVQFLLNYSKHAESVRERYSDKGNHLLFEAQRMIYAGAFFPEFKNAELWRKEGVDILNKEIEKQVYDDGLQYELSLNYHVASVNIFLKALYMAQLCGMDNEFPQSYKDIVENMIMAIINVSYPDYSFPIFSDAKLETKAMMLKNYKKWLLVFPNNEVLKYYASEGKKGQEPNYLSKGLTTSGFYAFRNGWSEDATVMILKASPPAFWHSQPDNGTFELWVKGRNFMPDAGAYVYAGNAEIMKMRNWYRQSRVHQTLTLNNENINVDAKLIRWEASPNEDVLVYVNPSYENLEHKRSVYFVNKKYFVIIDQAVGEATGNIDLHYQLVEGACKVNQKENWMSTDFADGNNLFVQCFSNKPISMIEEEGKVSYSYRNEVERPAYSFRQSKSDGETVRYITVVYPFQNEPKPKLKASFSKDGTTVNLKINGKTSSLLVVD